jgi:hypothetical protein
MKREKHYSGDQIWSGRGAVVWVSGVERSGPGTLSGGLLRFGEALLVSWERERKQMFPGDHAVDHHLAGRSSIITEGILPKSTCVSCPTD